MTPWFGCSNNHIIVVSAVAVAYLKGPKAGLGDIAVQYQYSTVQWCYRQTCAGIQGKVGVGVV